MRSAEGRLVLVAMFAATLALAGGSGLNVIVVVNQNSPNSLRLGNDYCEQRGVPGQNVFRLTGWTGGAISWDRAEFESLLLNPLLDMVATRNLADQAAFVLLSMDIPFQVIDGASVNSTTSALFYGFKTNSLPPDPSLPATCSLPDYSSNSFAFSELPFQTAPPDTAPTNSFLAMMLTDATLAGAELQLVGGVASDSSFPTQTVYLARTSDSARDVRYVEFDNAVFDSRVRGDYSVQRAATDSTSFTNSFGLLTGLADFSLPANAFVPGAIADSLTSFGGLILGPNDQTPLLAFLEAGAAGSYGTVVEPCNYVVKFPSPMDYVYQNRGFCLAEAYYQSILNPYQGLLAGEPLSAPFARRGRADWSSLNQGALVGGQVPIHIDFYAAPNLPLDQVDLFVDGSFFQTLTNLPPTAGNVLSVTLGGFGLDYVVPAQASLGSVAAGLASVLNGGTNSTQVMAYAIGDRLELDSLNPSTPGAEMSLGASVSSPPGVSQTTFVTPALPAFLDTVATGYLGMAVSNSPLVGDWVQLSFLKTNGAQLTVGLTNSIAGQTLDTFVQGLLDLINATPGLQSSDGVLASDFSPSSGTPLDQFVLYARSPGWPAAQIQVVVNSSSNLVLFPSGNSRLEDNLSDLRPRNHLYITSGASYLPVDFVLDTGLLPDGFHDLAAVAYEGSSVRTQTSVSRSIVVHNSALTATLTPLFAGTNVMPETQLQFSVSANSSNITQFELFGTGGSLGLIAGRPSGVFTVSFAELGSGLHPFYAVATDASGNQYRTQTLWLRLQTLSPSLAGPPWTLSWIAVPGQTYDILQTMNLGQSFQTVASVTPSNILGLWPLPAPLGPAAFYRIQLHPADGPPAP